MTMTKWLNETSAHRASQRAFYGLIVLFTTPFIIHFPFSLSMHGMHFLSYSFYKFFFCSGVISCIAIASFPDRKWGALGVSASIVGLLISTFFARLLLIGSR